jgi:DNA-binding IclR family transcriptional regulator
VYRAVGELVNAGLLEAGIGSHYRLGPAFVEFDRLTRLTDPLVREGFGLLRDIVGQVGVPCVGLLSRLYNDTVLCVADVANGSAQFRSSYERGRPMPLTRGATSKVILAHLPPRRRASLLGAPGHVPAELVAIRKRGFAVTRGEIDTGLVGLAAPVVCVPLGLFASISVVVRGSDLAEGSERATVLMLVSAASILTDALHRASGE